MRILVVSEVTGFMRGGVPAETTQLIRGLSDRGHQMALLGDVAPDGIGPVSLFPLSLPINRSLPKQLVAAINAFKPDLIHIMAMSSRGIMQIAPQLKFVPWVFTCHSLPPYERKLQYLHWNETAHYAARSLRFAPNIIAWKWLFRTGVIPHAIVHSHFVEDIIIRYGQPRNCTSLILLGYEVAKNEVRSARHVGLKQLLHLVTIGGIAHTKGHHDALMALASLRPVIPNFQYDIIGEVRDQSYVWYLETMIKSLGLGNSVRFLIDATAAEKDESLRRADIYLQPSHEEGFCLAYIEAASIVPLLVGTDTGAIKLISANDIGARVVPARQPSRIADAVRELCAISLPRDFMLQRQERLTSHFSWAKHIEAHELLYRRLVV
jgi:glycosyltransferase involved in cell wall biosynthesis